MSWGSNSFLQGCWAGRMRTWDFHLVASSCSTWSSCLQNRAFQHQAEVTVGERGVLVPATWSRFLHFLFHYGVFIVSFLTHEHINSLFAYNSVRWVSHTCNWKNPDYSTKLWAQPKGQKQKISKEVKRTEIRRRSGWICLFLGPQGWIFLSSKCSKRSSILPNSRVSPFRKQMRWYFLPMIHT